MLDNFKNYLNVVIKKINGQNGGIVFTFLNQEALRKKSIYKAKSLAKLLEPKSVFYKIKQVLI